MTRHAVEAAMQRHQLPLVVVSVDGVSAPRLQEAWAAAHKGDSRVRHFGAVGISPVQKRWLCFLQHGGRGSHQPGLVPRRPGWWLVFALDDFFERFKVHSAFEPNAVPNAPECRASELAASDACSGQPKSLTLYVVDDVCVCSRVACLPLSHVACCCRSRSGGSERPFVRVWFWRGRHITRIDSA